MGKKSMGLGFSLAANAGVSAVSTSPARFLDIIYDGRAALQIQLIRLPFYEWSCNVRNQFDNVARRAANTRLGSFKWKPNKCFRIRGFVSSLRMHNFKLRQFTSNEFISLVHFIRCSLECEFMQLPSFALHRPTSAPSSRFRNAFSARSFKGFANQHRFGYQRRVVIICEWYFPFPVNFEPNRYCMKFAISSIGEFIGIHVVVWFESNENKSVRKIKHLGPFSI